jgi:plastocyanin
MRPVIAATLVCLAAVACGKGKSSDSGGSAPVSLSGTVNDHGTKDLKGKDETEVEIDDFYFGPTYLKVANGATVKLELSNEGKNQHTFTAPALGVDETLAPGASKDVTVTMPAAGAVGFFCRFHQGQGMQGALYANAGDTVTTGSAPASSSGDSGGAYGK